MQRNDAPSNLTGRVIRGVGLAAGGYTLSQILTLIAYLVLARLATPEEFGQLAAAMILIGIGYLAVEAGLLSAVVQRPDRIEEAANTALISTVAAGLIFCLISVVTSPLLGMFFHDDTVAALAAAMSGLLILRAIPIVPEALLQRRLSFLRRVVVEPLSTVAFATAAIIATSSGLGVWGLAIGHYAAAIAEVTLSWALVRWRPNLRLASWSMWRSLIDYGRHVFGATVILRVGEQVPVALLGRFDSSAAIGQFRYADRVASTPYAGILAAASYVLFPAMARIAGDRERLVAAFMRSFRWMAAIALPLGLILIPLGVPLVVLAFGEVWRPAGEAVAALSIFTAASPFISLASETFKAEGSPQTLIRMHLVTTISGAVAMVALLGFDLIGVSIGVSVGALIGACYALVMCRRILGVTLGSMLRELAPFAIASLVMVALTLALTTVLDPTAHSIPIGLAMVAVLGAIGFGVYGAIVHVLAPDVARDGRRLLASARNRQSGGDPQVPYDSLEEERVLDHE